MSLLPNYSPRSLRLIAAGIVVLNGFFPAVWILLTSLKTETELVRKPITYLPHNPTLQNYVQAFTDQPLLRFLGNSFAVAIISTIASLFVAALAAYAIARLNLKRKQLILTCIVASSMFPLVTLLVPIFETMRALGLLNTYTALVLPYVVLNLPVCTLVLVSFFQSIPKDLENAAMIDGCTRLGALWKVVVPLASTRSRIPISPKPSDEIAGVTPAPSSTTSTTRPSCSVCTSTRARVAGGACRRTLLNASCTTR